MKMSYQIVDFGDNKKYCDPSQQIRGFNGDSQPKTAEQCKQECDAMDNCKFADSWTDNGCGLFEICNEVPLPTGPGQWGNALTGVQNTVYEKASQPPPDYVYIGLGFCRDFNVGGPHGASGEPLANFEKKLGEGNLESCKQYCDSYGTNNGVPVCQGITYRDIYNGIANHENNGKCQVHLGSQLSSVPTTGPMGEAIESYPGDGNWHKKAFGAAGADITGSLDRPDLEEFACYKKVS